MNHNIVEFIFVIAIYGIVLFCIFIAILFKIIY